MRLSCDGVMMVPVAELSPNPDRMIRRGFVMSRAGGAFMTLDSATNLHELISTAEAATACGVGSSTISKWVSRGHLSPSGLDEMNRPLYRLGDVLVAARDTRQRAVGHRRIA